MSKFTKGDKVVRRLNGDTYTVFEPARDSIGAIVVTAEGGWRICPFEDSLTLVPDTVLVEIPRKDAKALRDLSNYNGLEWLARLSYACRTALEKEQG